MATLALWRRGRAGSGSRGPGANGPGTTITPRGFRARARGADALLQALRPALWAILERDRPGAVNRPVPGRRTRDGRHHRSHGMAPAVGLSPPQRHPQPPGLAGRYTRRGYQALHGQGQPRAQHVGHILEPGRWRVCRGLVPSGSPATAHARSRRPVAHRHALPLGRQPHEVHQLLVELRAFIVH